jgi:hypothetical protein
VGVSRVWVMRCSSCVRGSAVRRVGVV